MIIEANLTELLCTYMEYVWLQLLIQQSIIHNALAAT